MSSRIGKIPTIEKETFNALLASFVITKDKDSFNKLKALEGNRKKSKAFYTAPVKSYFYDDKLYVMEEIELIEDNLKRKHDDVSGARIASVEMDRIFRNRSKIHLWKSTSKHIKFALDRGLPIYTDSDGRMMMQSKLRSKPEMKLKRPKAEYLLDPRSILRSMAIHQTPSTKLSGKSITKMLDKYLKMVDDMDDHYEHAVEWLTALLKMSDGRHSKRVLSEATELIHCRGLSNRSTHLSDLLSYKCNKFFFFYFDDCTIILDQNSVEEVRRVAVGVFNAQMYQRLWMLSDSKEEEVKRRIEVFDKCYDLCVNGAIELLHAGDYFGKVPKSIKTLAASFYNDIGEDDVLQDECEKQRDQLLLEAKETWAGIAEVERLIKMLSKDQWIDMASILQLITCEDGDIESLHQICADKMNAAKGVKEEVAEHFLKYSISYITCVVLTKTKGRCKTNKDEGYLFKDSKWYKQCCRGILTMPPAEEYGKIWIEDHFPYLKKLETNHLSAKDVNYVEDSMYKLKTKTVAIPDFSTNELEETFKYGPVTNGVNNSELRKAVQEKVKPTHNVDLLSCKSENTKFGPKSRDIHSASRTSRKVLSEFDKNIAVVLSYFVGCCHRMNNDSIARDLLNENTEMFNLNRIICMSLDVSGWSVGMSRELVGRFYKIVIRMFKSKHLHLDLMEVLEGHILISIHEGKMRTTDITDGMCQGWTAALDTLLHLCMISYSVRRAKQQKLLSYDESAKPFSLIDDGVIVFKLNTDIRVPEAKERVKKLRDSVIETYKCLGFVIDPVKTIVSSRTITFLNSIYSNGGEVITAQKLFQKIDIALNETPTSTLSEVDSIWTTAAAASQHGGDPYACYFYALYKSWCTIAARCHKTKLWDFKSSRLAVIGFAPRDFGGYGFPTIVEFLCSSKKDSLYSFINIYSEFYKVMKMAKLEEVESCFVLRCVGSILKQEMVQGRYLPVISTPYKITIKGVKNPVALCSSLVQDVLLNRIQYTSVKSAIKFSMDDDIDRALGEILTNGVFDAVLLEKMGEATPWSVFQALIAQLKKSSTMIKMVGAINLSRIRREVRIADEKQLQHLLNLPVLPEGSLFPIDISAVNSIRTCWYNLHSMIVTNHTTPNGLSSFAHVEKKHNTGVIQIDGLTQLWRDSSYHVGISRARKPFFGARVSPAARINEVYKKITSPLTAGLMDLLALLQVARDRGQNAEAVRKFYSHIWFGDTKTLDQIEFPQKNIVNTKSMSTRAQKSVQIGLQKSMSGIVQMNDTSLLDQFKLISTRHHYLMQLMELRASALLDFIAREYEGRERYYVVDSSTLILNDTRLCILPSDFEKMIDFSKLDHFGSHVPEALEVLKEDIDLIQSGLEEEANYEDLLYADPEECRVAMAKAEFSVAQRELLANRMQPTSKEVYQGSADLLYAKAAQILGNPLLSLDSPAEARSILRHTIVNFNAKCCKVKEVAATLIKNNIKIAQELFGSVELFETMDAEDVAVKIMLALHCMKPLENAISDSYCGPRFLQYVSSVSTGSSVMQRARRYFATCTSWKTTDWSRTKSVMKIGLQCARKVAELMGYNHSYMKLNKVPEEVEEGKMRRWCYGSLHGCVYKEGKFEYQGVLLKGENPIEFQDFIDWVISFIMNYGTSVRVECAPAIDRPEQGWVAQEQEIDFSAYEQYAAPETVVSDWQLGACWALSIGRRMPNAEDAQSYARELQATRPGTSNYQILLSLGLMEYIEYVPEEAEEPTELNADSNR